jgi:ribonuclease HI
VVNPTPLSDDTCGPASEAPAGRGSSKKKKKTATDPRPHAGKDGTIVYTDGACSGNPGPAGLGIVVDREDERIERYEYLGEGTNNIAELTAVLRALEELAEAEAALVHTDSQYTIGMAQKGWKPKANHQLVADLRKALAAHPEVELVYVRGHAGVELNERADELARRAIMEGRSARSVTRRPTSA